MIDTHEKNYNALAEWVKVTSTQGYTPNRPVEVEYELPEGIEDEIPDLDLSEEEDSEWTELEERALPSERLDAVAEYLRSSGQASA